MVIRSINAGCKIQILRIHLDSMVSDHWKSDPRIRDKTAKEFSQRYIYAVIPKILCIDGVFYNALLQFELQQVSSG